jgi:hypothetical protein
VLFQPDVAAQPRASEGEAMTRADLVDLAHDVASLIATAAFVVGVGVFVIAIPEDRITASDSRTAACELAALEPTDFNIEACTGQPIDLAPSKED